jgi:RimJ/RimL family protein N-acetyltransferase
MVRWDGEVVLTTDRLSLRTFRRDDLPHYAALNADPAVVEFLGGPLTREYSDEIAEWANERWELERIGLLAVERRSDATFLGMCGVHHQESYPDDLEVGWRLAHDHWGQGYATEAARAWLDYAFGVLGAPRVISITDHPNVRSLAVMHRLGMTFDHEGQVEGDGVTFDAVIYSITANEWRRRTRASSTPA